MTPGQGWWGRRTPPKPGLAAFSSRLIETAPGDRAPRLVAIVLVSSLTLLLAACDSGPPSNAPVAATPLGPVPLKPGGSLTFSSESGIQSFNLNTSAGAGLEGQSVMNRVWPQVFFVDGLLRPTLDTDFVQSAELISTNPQTIVYKINPSAIWSDGVPITADDFVYNWKAQDGTGTDIDGKPFDAVSTSGYEDIKSITGTDNEKTVTVVFSQPYGDWESLFSNLIPAHIARKVGWNHGFDTFSPTTIISGGPFMVAAVVPGQEIVLTRNPHYWGPAAKLDQIVFKVQGDQSQDPLLLQLQQVQMIYPFEPPLSLVESVKQLPGLAHQTNQGMTFEHLAFNQRNVFLADPKVRQAIAEATNRKELIADTVGKVNRSIKPLNNRIFVNSQPGYQDNSAGFDYDLAGARQLLEQDGFVTGPDGYLQKGGATLELRLSTTASSSLRIGIELVFIGQMKALGVKIDVANIDPATLVSSVLPSGNFDVAVLESTASSFPSWSSSSYQTNDPVSHEGTQNYYGYSNPQVDTWFTQASMELNQNRSTAIYNEIDQQLWKDMVTLPLFQVPTFIAYSKSYVNIADNTSSFGPFWDADTWGIRATPLPKGRS